MKKLMFFICSLRIGGSEKALVRMANAIVQGAGRNGASMYDVTVIMLFGGGALERELDEAIHVISVFPHFVRGVARLSGLLPPSLIHRLFVRDEYDVEIAVGDGLESHVISGSANPNKYSWVHMDVRFHGDKASSKTQKRYSAFKSIICVSRTAAEGFAQKYDFSGKIRVAYTPIDCRSLVAAAKEEVALPCGALVAVGRLERVKGFDRLISAVALTRLDDVRLYIIGNGTEREALEALIRDNRLEKQITLLGEVNNPYAYIARAKALICSSQNESFGFTLAEAMLLRTPVLSTRCGGPEEIIRSESEGILCENTTEGLAHALSTIDASLKKLDTEEAHNRALMFNASECVDAFLSIILF